MAELKFAEDDGPIQLRLADHDAIVEGKGLIRYFRRGMLRSVALQRFHRSTLLRYLDTITKVATIISLFGMVVLWVWKWQAGAAVPAFVSISSNVFSVAFLGSLFSYGGVNIVSLQAQSQANEMSVENLTVRCPFKDLVKDPFGQVQQPGNPDFCVKCPLGVDTIDERERGFLIHNCCVYNELHTQWRTIHNNKVKARRI